MTQQVTDTAAPGTETPQPAAATGGADTLYAGKYTSIEELVAGYKALEAKLGAPKEEPAPAATPEKPAETPKEEPKAAEPEKPEEAPKEEPKPEEAPEPSPYGSEMDVYIKDAGVDPHEMARVYEETGDVPAEMLDKLYGKFGKPMVDSYIANAKAARREVEQQTQALLTEVGGEQAYAAMMQWAQANVPGDQQATFQQHLNSGNMETIQQAVRAMHAAYSQAEGRKPTTQLHGGGGAAGGTQFSSLAEYQQAVNDARYGQDVGYTAAVQQRFQNTPLSVLV